MTLKMKLMSTIAAFLLILGLTIMGVMAAPSATVNLGGSISFTATDVNAKVTGDISGATNSPEELPELLFSAGLDDAALTELNADIAKWGECDLEFDSTGTGLSILVTIENLAERPLYATINTSATMTAGVTSTMEELTAADAESGTPYTGGTITIPAKSGETTYFAYVRLNLEVSNKNASLATGSTWGYKVTLNDAKAFDAQSIKENNRIIVERVSGQNYAQAKMISMSETTGDIVIPPYLYEDGVLYPVTTIPANAFSEYNEVSNGAGLGASISSISLPNTITNIGGYAFAKCSNLLEVVVPDSVNSLGYYVFRGCANLKTLKIGKGMTSVGIYMFKDCTSLENLILSTSSINNTDNSKINNDSVNGTLTIEAATLSGGKGLNDLLRTSMPNLVLGKEVETISLSAAYGIICDTVVVEESNEVFYSVDNCVISKDTNTLVFGGNEALIPDVVTSIGKCAFAYTDIENLVIPSNVQTIGGYAFWNSGIRTITIPTSVKEIGSHAFYGCSGLTTVNYRGTQEQWDAIVIDNTYSGNQKLIDANKVYNYQG